MKRAPLSARDGFSGHCHRKSNHFNPCAPPTAAAYLSHTHVRHAQTCHHNHNSCGVTQLGRFAALFQAQPLQQQQPVLHPCQQRQLAAQPSNAFAPSAGRVLFNHSFIKRSSCRQQNHSPCMQGVTSDLFYYYVSVFRSECTLFFSVTLRRLILNWRLPP